MFIHHILQAQPSSLMLFANFIILSIIYLQNPNYFYNNQKYDLILQVIRLRVFWRIDEEYRNNIHKDLVEDNLQQHIPGQAVKKKEGSELESTISDGSEQEASTVSDAYDPNFNLDDFFSPSNVITEEMVQQPREEEIAVEERVVRQEVKDYVGQKEFEKSKVATEKIQKVEKAPICSNRASVAGTARNTSFHANFDCPVPGSSIPQYENFDAICIFS